MKKKRNYSDKTEILEDDFLNALAIEIEKKYPNNTNLNTNNNIEEADNVELLDDENFQERSEEQQKNIDNTIEILEDIVENQDKSKIAKANLNSLDNTIEILEDLLDEKQQSHEKSKKRNNPVRNLENTIEFLEDFLIEQSGKKDFDSNRKVDKKEKDLEDTIELLNDKFKILSNPNTNLEDTIEILRKDIPTLKISQNEEIEILEEEIDEFEKPSKNLENTIDLLEIVKKTEPIQVRHRIKPKKRPWIILLSVCILLISFFIYKGFFWQRDSIKTNQQIEKIVKTTKTNQSLIKKENIAGATVPEDERYFQYLDVDFTDLLKQNDEVKGWIKVPNTNINYPFVQTDNNEFYLKHSFNKKYNSAGWVFADYRNNFENPDQNTILYAHGRLDNTMFGSLKKVVEKNWYENIENQFLQMSTLTTNTIWQVFSVYTIEPEIYYITPNFDTTEEYIQFLDDLKKRSVHDFEVSLSENDRILTLSSCYNSTLRVVLHAKLVNIEQK